MALAEELGLPLLTVTDTGGAALSKEAEEGGLAGEIARSIHDLIRLNSPTVSVLLGQGTGGRALALFPADRTIPAQHALAFPPAARRRQELAKCGPLGGPADTTHR
jgi:acetyl-CoA carboxylase carboxyl transferase subunit beta